MATVISIDGTEAINTLRARLRYAADGRVVFIIPPEAERMRDPVYLKLLARAAQQYACDIALVTRDRRIRENARAQGIPVYAHLAEVNREWPQERMKFPTPQSFETTSSGPRVTLVGIVIALLGSLLVGLAALAVAMFILPSATITLVPASEAFSQTVEITATTRYRARASEESQIPARPIEVRIEVADRISTTGRKLSPAESAAGQVTLANKTDAPVKVPKGSRVGTSNGAVFYTLDEVTLPPQQWGTARVGVIAAKPGSEGNVPAQAISEVMDPALMFRITVMNENPTTGGSDKWVNFVTIEDRNRLKARLVERLKQEALPHLLAAKSEAESIYPETVAATLVEESYDRAVGEEADFLTLRLSATVRGLAFEGAAANDVAARLLAARIPRGTQLLPGSFRTTPLEAYEWDANSVTFRLLVEGRIYSAIDTAKVRQAVLGMTISEAEAYLARNLPLAAKPQVRVQPAWATTIPLLAPRVAVKVLSEANP